MNIGVCGGFDAPCAGGLLRQTASLTLRIHWLSLANMSQASAMLSALGGNENMAMRSHAWAQNPQYRDKEVLVARLLALPEKLSNLPALAGSPDQGRLLAEVRALATDYAVHREAFDALPPAGPVPEHNDDPMQPVPDLRALTLQAKRTDLAPSNLKALQDKGLYYTGKTVAVVSVRHGETNHNATPGGVAGGSLLGPHGAQLTPAARDAAAQLRSTLQALADQGVIKWVGVSPVDRADQTYRLATQGVQGLPEPTYDTRHREYSVGGFANMLKIAPGNAKYESQYDVQIGRNAEGGLGVDFNNMPRDWVPSLDVYFPNTPRYRSPVFGQPQAESRQQHFERSQQVLIEKVSELGDGQAGIIFGHQFSIGNMDHALHPDHDYMLTGHGIPNVAPQYWIIHVFEDVNGNTVLVPATAGQGDLAPPGVTPKGQTPR